jgi:hypothetical protein
VQARYPATRRAARNSPERRSDNGILDNWKIRREGRDGRGGRGEKLGEEAGRLGNILFRYRGVIFFRAAQVQDL